MFCLWNSVSSPHLWVVLRESHLHSCLSFCKTLCLYLYLLFFMPSLYIFAHYTISFVIILNFVVLQRNSVFCLQRAGIACSLLNLTCHIFFNVLCCQKFGTVSVLHHTSLNPTYVVEFLFAPSLSVTCATSLVHY